MPLNQNRRNCSIRLSLLVSYLLAFTAHAQPPEIKLSDAALNAIVKPSSEEVEVVNFGPSQTAESLRLRSLFDYGFQDMAVAEARKYLQQNPQDIDIRQTLATIYLEQKKDELAEQQLQLVQLWKTWRGGHQALAMNQAIELRNKNPDDNEINYILGYFYFLQKNYLQASQALELALHKEPGYVSARALLINVYLASGNYSQATMTLNQGWDPNSNLLKVEKKLIQRAQDISSIGSLLPDKKENMTDKANIPAAGAAASLAKFDSLWKIWSAGKQKEALEDAASYFKNNPDDLRIALVLGQFYALQNKYPEAIQQYNSVLSKNPTYVQARVSLADAYILTKHDEMAQRVIEQGLELTPDNAELLAEKQSVINTKKFNALWQLWNKGDETQAINQAQDYLKSHSNNPGISLSLGQFYFLKKDYPAAREQIEKVLIHDPNYIGARISLIEVHLTTKNFAEATKVLQEGLKLAPRDPNLLAEEKVIANAQRESTDTVFAPISSKKTGEALNEFNALWKLWKSGLHSTAITKASNYLKQNPDDLAVGLSLGQFYFLEKNYALALSQLRGVLSKEPTYAAAIMTLIDVDLATKNYAQAKKDLNKGLNLLPTDSALLRYRQLIKDAENPKPVAAEEIKPASPQYWSYVEGGALYADLTSGYNHWFNQYLKTVIQKDPDNVWLAEIIHGYEFDQKANYGLVQETHNFNKNWYGTLNLGISDNSIYVPKYYIGATLARRLLTSKQLIVYFQGQAYWFRPVYKLEVLNPGLIYYFNRPWILEAGGYFNRSNPGRVDTAVGYLAVTQGRDKEHYLTLRLAWGREGYLPLFNNAAIVGYPSIVATGTWRQWLGQHWGWNIIAENYHNRFYNRYGISFGLFKEFSV